jgi:hypothetical protein
MGRRERARGKENSPFLLPPSSLPLARSSSLSPSLPSSSFLPGFLPFFFCPVPLKGEEGRPCYCDNGGANCARTFLSREPAPHGTCTPRQICPPLKQLALVPRSRLSCIPLCGEQHASGHGESESALSLPPTSAPTAKRQQGLGRSGTGAEIRLIGPQVLGRRALVVDQSDTDRQAICICNQQSASNVGCQAVRGSGD